MNLSDLLAPWHDFYALLGSASGTLVGLLFVAVTVGTGVFTGERRAPMRMFLSASVIHFSSVLAVCLTVMAPLGSAFATGGIIAAGGVFGLGYYAATWRDSVQDGLHKSIDLEDRIWYAVLPILAYALEAVAGAGLCFRPRPGCAAVALSVSALLLIGIHNAWDITLWSMTRRRQ